jgi:hypothetical protein
MGGMFSARNTVNKVESAVRGPASPPPPKPAGQMADASTNTLLGGSTATTLTSSQGLAGLGDTTKKQLLGS